MAEATLEGRETLPAQDVEVRGVSPTRYRTFSRKLPFALTALGGVITILGGLGTWVRTAKATRLGDNLQDTGAAMGYDQTLGWVLAGLGVLAVAGALAWLRSSFLPKLVPILSAVAIAAIIAQRLPILDRQVDRMVTEASKQLGFSGFHAGFGWGAWLLLVASVLLLLGAFAGILREIDLRRGIPE